MPIYKCHLQRTTPGLLLSLSPRSAVLGDDVTGVKGQGLRARSSEVLLVSSLCPASFPLRCKHRNIKTSCHTQLCLFSVIFSLCNNLSREIWQNRAIQKHLLFIMIGGSQKKCVYAALYVWKILQRIHVPTTFSSSSLAFLSFQLMSFFNK